MGALSWLTPARRAWLYRLLTVVVPVLIALLFIH